MNVDDKIEISLRHFKMLKEHYNERLSVNLSKKHFNYYFKGFEGASYWRKKFMHISDLHEINDLMQKMKETLLSKTI